MHLMKGLFSFNFLGVDPCKVVLDFVLLWLKLMSLFKGNEFIDI